MSHDRKQPSTAFVWFVFLFCAIYLARLRDPSSSFLPAYVYFPLLLLFSPLVFVPLDHPHVLPFPPPPPGSDHGDEQPSLVFVVVAVNLTSPSLPPLPASSPVFLSPLLNCSAQGDEIPTRPGSVLFIHCVRSTPPPSRPSFFSPKFLPVFVFPVHHHPAQGDEKETWRPAEGLGSVFLGFSNPFS
ncbi:hypothetical protein MAPG_10724 [Magnaporthiopsis poae ATCC 64411]|uniref:Uncharacterized protein n=1 Tax=Magnaporthiopsis poae (strain ATCC 64411 / 73-15) TaxID=644358 RepID=A0A0C4EDC9_MAGP6|nr:hypothetical protein MAPG_10724 [Magnaporthiopsis poae ATCC 64411]